MRLSASLSCFRHVLQRDGLFKGLYKVAPILRDCGVGSAEIQLAPSMGVRQCLALKYILQEHRIDIASVHAEKDLFDYKDKEKVQRLSLQLNLLNPGLVVMHPVLSEHFMEELEELVCEAEKRLKQPVIWTLELICKEPAILDFPWEDIRPAGMTLDIYHAYQLNCDPDELIARYHKLICNVHMRECVRNQPDFIQYMHEILNILCDVGYSGLVTLEMDLDDRRRLESVVEDFYAVVGGCEE